MDIVVSLISVFISLIAIYQARKSNALAKESKEVAKEANKISEEAKMISIDELNDTQKDYMPIIVFDKEIRCEILRIEELCLKVTFDFEKLINEESYYECADYYPVVVTIKNIGKGVISKIEINSVLICEGNKTRFDKCFPDNGLSLLEWYEPESCTSDQEMYFDKDQELYLLLSNKDYTNFFDSHNEVLVMMDLVLHSINKSKYKQTIWGNFLNGKLVLCSFDATAYKDKYSMDKNLLYKK